MNIIKIINREKNIQVERKVLTGQKDEVVEDREEVRVGGLHKVSLLQVLCHARHTLAIHPLLSLHGEWFEGFLISKFKFNLFYLIN